jgi:hypothetical protein
MIEIVNGHTANLTSGNDGNDELRPAAASTDQTQRGR